MKRRGEPEPTFRRRPVDFTPAQVARQAEVTAELHAIARERHPERYAPTGEPLIAFPGASWTARLYAWRAQNGYPGLPASDSFGSVESSADGGASLVGSRVVARDFDGQAGTPL